MRGGLAIAAALLLGLNGCATPADPAMMTVSRQQASAPFPAQLQHAMCVRKVSGGEATNPLWASQVGNADFQTALWSSLRTAGLASQPGACRYQIDIDLLGLSQPIAGFDVTVTSHVNYKVYDLSGKPFVLETISTPFETTASDVSLGTDLIQIASEGSIRTNIQRFFEKLRAADLQ